MTKPSSNRLRRLECIRGAAALYVVAHHYVHVVFANQPTSFAKFFKFGQFAVLLFFVTSGFVIYYSTVVTYPGVGFRGYFLRRFRRIYPPFLFALLVAYVAQCGIDGGWADPKWGELVGNLFMLQDLNVKSWFSPYLKNESLWSLSYEWAFYMLFFPIVWVSGRVVSRRAWVVLGLAVVGFATYWYGGANISLFLMYLPIWWAGVELAREYIETKDVTFAGQWVPIGSIAVLTGLWGVTVARFVAAGNTVVMWEHPVIEFRHFATSLLILVGGIAWHRLRWRGFYAILGPFERVAPISYGLYVVHLPLVHYAAGRLPTGNRWLELLWLVPAIFALAWIGERFLHRYAVRWIRG